MDRYLEPDPDDLAGQEKRAKTVALRKEIESLRGRLGELTTNISGDKVLPISFLDHRTKYLFFFLTSVRPARCYGTCMVSYHHRVQIGQGWSFLTVYSGRRSWSI